MKTFTLIHVAISLIAIFAGSVVVFGLVKGRQLEGWARLFLATTALTTITGFFFPFHGVTPAIVVGVVSLIPLCAAIYGLYWRRLGGAWRRLYVISALVSLYLNVFVLVAQSFDKIPPLNALAPTPKHPLFQITQLIVLILFIGLGAAAAKNFRSAQPLSA